MAYAARRRPTPADENTTTADAGRVNARNNHVCTFPAHGLPCAVCTGRLLSRAARDATATRSSALIFPASESATAIPVRYQQTLFATHTVPLTKRYVMEFCYTDKLLHIIVMRKVNMNTIGTRRRTTAACVYSAAALFRQDRHARVYIYVYVTTTANAKPSLNCSCR